VLPTANIIQRIVFVAYGTMTGTGFTIEVDDHQYIVTAAHIVKGLGSRGRIELHRDGKWGQIDVDRLRSVSGRDVAVLYARGAVVTQTLPVAFSDTADHYYYGQHVFMMGFPFGEPVGDVVLADGHPLPLVKAGALAGFYKLPSGHNRLLIDAHANKGFSGGPIFCYPLSGSPDTTRVIGVVTEVRVEWGKVRKMPGEVGTNLEARYHSHITFGEDIAYALEDIAARKSK
jgi:hypothetical protein